MKSAAPVIAPLRSVPRGPRQQSNPFDVQEYTVEQHVIIHSSRSSRSSKAQPLPETAPAGDLNSAFDSTPRPCNWANQTLHEQSRKLEPVRSIAVAPVRLLTPDAAVPSLSPTASRWENGSMFYILPVRPLTPSQRPGSSIHCHLPSRSITPKPSRLSSQVGLQACC